MVSANALAKRHRIIQSFAKSEGRHPSFYRGLPSKVSWPAPLKQPDMTKLSFSTPLKQQSIEIKLKDPFPMIQKSIKPKPFDDIKPKSFDNIKPKPSDDIKLMEPIPYNKPISKPADPITRTRFEPRTEIIKRVKNSSPEPEARIPSTYNTKTSSKSLFECFEGIPTPIIFETTIKDHSPRYGPHTSVKSVTSPLHSSTFGPMLAPPNEPSCVVFSSTKKPFEPYIPNLPGNNSYSSSQKFLKPIKYDSISNRLDKLEKQYQRECWQLFAHPLNQVQQTYVSVTKQGPGVDWNTRLQKEKLIARVAALNKQLRPNRECHYESEPTDMNENRKTGPQPARNTDITASGNNQQQAGSSSQSTSSSASHQQPSVSDESKQQTSTSSISVGKSSMQPKEQDKPMDLMSACRSTTMTVTDLACLNPTEELYDSVIDSYLVHLLRNSGATDFGLMTSMFYRPTMQIDGGRLGFEEEMQSSDASKFPKIIIPIHKSFHWYLIVVNNPGQSIDIYDSIKHDFNYYSLASAYISSCWNINYKINIVPNIPKQSNGYDCGVYVLRFAEALLNNPKDLHSAAINPHSISNYRAIIKQNLNKSRDKTNFARIIQPQYFINKSRKVAIPSYHQGTYKLQEISVAETTNILQNPTGQDTKLSFGTQKAVKMCTARLAKLSTNTQSTKITCSGCKKEFTKKVLIAPSNRHLDFLNRNAVEFSNIMFCRYIIFSYNYCLKLYMA